MTKIEILTAIVQKILPLEEKYGCNIFLDYASHVKAVTIYIHSLGYEVRTTSDFFETIYIGSLGGVDGLKQKIESHIIEQQSKKRDLKQEKIERLEKELEELRGEK